MREIEFYGQKIMLHHRGLLIWPDEKLAVVSDLHLGKGSHFAMNGQFLPPHDSVETLLNLKLALKSLDIERLVFLGDSFHDSQGSERLGDKEHKLIKYFTDHYQLIWIIGNHDMRISLADVTMKDDLKIRNITFRHEHEKGSKGEVSGHFHPKAAMRLYGKKVSRPCFLHNDHRIILPSFRAFTGGMFHTDKVFENIMGEDYCIGLVGQRRLYYFSSANLN